MELAYRKYGENGQPLIILHGLFGQSDNWTSLAKRFGNEGFSVFTVDLRNHGLSPHSSEWNYEAMASDIKEFIITHQLSDTILLGHSMGGKVSMFFDLNYPNQLNKLIVADIAPREYKPHHAAVLEALQKVNFDKIKTRKEAESILNENIPDFGTRQFLLKNIYWEDSNSEKMNWRFNLKVIANQYEEICVEAPRKTSETNTLFLRGGNSTYIGSEDIEDIANRFPNYQLKTIDNCGHWLHAEKPDEFFDLVLNFIK